MDYRYNFLIFDDPVDPEPTPAADGYDGGEYCDFDTAAAILAGKDILLGIWNADGSALLAISGQQSLTINRSAETIEVNSKSTEGGWKDNLAGMKEWSIDNGGIWVPTEDSHKALAKAFDKGDPVCIKVYNNKEKKGMFGGLAIITDYPIEAPYDDAVTYSITLQGKGRLVDFSIDPPETDTMPDGTDDEADDDDDNSTPANNG